MATNTPNLNLVKPEMADYADIRVLNGNMDILDNAIGGLDYVKNVTKSDEGLTFTKKDDTQNKVTLVGELAGDSMKKTIQKITTNYRKKKIFNKLYIVG